MPASSASVAAPIDTSGEIVTTDGTVVGRHDGFERFTVGQRKGLRLAFGEPRYVVRIEPDTHRVVIGTQEELARSELVRRRGQLADGGEGSGERGEAGAGGRDQGSVNLDISNSANLRLLPSRQVKIRYRSRPAAATVELLPGRPFPRPLRRALLRRRSRPGRRLLRRRSRPRRRLDRMNCCLPPRDQAEVQPADPDHQREDEHQADVGQARSAPVSLAGLPRMPS